MPIPKPPQAVVKQANPDHKTQDEAAANQRTQCLILGQSLRLYGYLLYRAGQPQTKRLLRLAICFGKAYLYLL